MRKKRLTRSPRPRKKELPRVPIVWRALLFCQRVVVRPRVLGSIMMLCGTSLFYNTGSYHALVRGMDRASLGVADVLGLKLQNIYQEGQRYTDSQDILNAIDVKLGQPLLSIDLQDMRQRLEDLTWVRYAVVERQYPSTLSVRMIERNPAALWQHNGEVQLIDEAGEVIRVKTVKEFSDKIILVGKDVPVHARSLLQMLHKFPETEHLVSSAVRVGERRWDIHLFNGIEIKLPEENPEDAWRFVSDKHKEEEILNGDIKSIDLKVPDKMFIKRKV